MYAFSQLNKKCYVLRRLFRSYSGIASSNKQSSLASFQCINHLSRYSNVISLFRYAFLNNAITKCLYYPRHYEIKQVPYIFLLNYLKQCEWNWHKLVKHIYIDNKSINCYKLHSSARCKLWIYHAQFRIRKCLPL